MYKITKIEIQKNNKDRVNVYINEEFSFACDGEVVYKYGLSKNKKVDLDEMKLMVEEDDYIKGKNYIFRVIEKGPKTQKQIEDKLKNKGYNDKTTQRVVLFMKEYNFLDDTNYAKLFIKDKMKNQGKNKIKYTLKQKGIDDKIINEMLYTVDEDTEMQSALDLCKKKYKIISSREIDKMKLKSKLYSYLSYKGYSYDVIMKAINSIINEE